MVAHFSEKRQLFISAVTEFEIFNGATAAHKEFWDGMLQRMTVLDFDRRAARQAAEIVGHLKPKRKTIDKPDLFIAATAITHGLALDTFNTKHFADIDALKLF